MITAAFTLVGLVVSIVGAIVLGYGARAGHAADVRPGGPAEAAEAPRMKAAPDLWGLLVVGLGFLGQAIGAVLSAFSGCVGW
jgi:hypothetical protein